MIVGKALYFHRRRVASMPLTDTLRSRFFATCTPCLGRVELHGLFAICIARQLEWNDAAIC